MEFPEFKEAVTTTWKNATVTDNPMYVLWENLKVLKPVIRKMGRKTTKIESRIKPSKGCPGPGESPKRVGSGCIN